MTQRPFFNSRDVGLMWAQEAARKAGKTEEEIAAVEPFSNETVRSHVRHSRPDVPGRKPHRYADNPCPMPTYVNDLGTDAVGPNQRRTMIWVPDEGETLAELERRLRAWIWSREGPGAGGGRPPRQRRQTAAERAGDPR